MSDDVSQCDNILSALERLQLNNTAEIPANKPGTTMPQEPNGTHDLTCRMPQTAGDMDNCDDTDTDSDVIVVVDSSNASSDVSFLRTSILSISSNSVLASDQWDCISVAETIPETESDDSGDSNGSTDDVIIMDQLVSTPIKRKHDFYSNTTETQSFKGIPRLGLGVHASPVVNPMVFKTRSGRTVRARIDTKFDYSSEQQDEDSDDANDPDFGDTENEDDEDNDADDDGDQDFDEEKRNEPTPKQRRVSMRSSCCSNSDASSMLETDAFIYLDLRHPVATVVSEPTADAAVEFDSGLKTRLQKMLGLVAPQRRLYNPINNFELEDNHMDEDEPTPMLRSRLWATNSNSQSLNVPQPAVTVLSSPAVSRLNALGADITNDMKMLLIDDMVQRANANYFESQTPQHIKEPIDLSGLPSEEQRAINCQRHKKSISSIGPYTGLYSFVDSLKLTTPLSMCHPLAVNYRKRDFETCKVSLAKTLFNILNHTIFHCGLRSSIAWKMCMNTPSSSVHQIEAGGQRVSRIILFRNIKQSGILVKALLHEMCHAAAFVYHGETGHGDNCRKWAYRAKSLLPELPEIGDCNAGYKYTCLLCRGRSFGRIKFEDEAQQLRCHYCQFEVNVEHCSAENVHNLSLTDQLVTPFKEFVRANYANCEQSGHSAKMRALNVLYKEQQQQGSSN